MTMRACHWRRPATPAAASPPAPLLVVALVLVETLYMEDTLGQRAHLPGRPSP